MTNADFQAVIDANSDVIETFVSKYMIDTGIGVQMVDVITRELFGQQAGTGNAVLDNIGSSPASLFSTAISDVINISPFMGATYELRRVIEGAASLEFLVRYARKVDPTVILPEVIPSDEVVQAALALFHKGYQNESVSEAS